MNLKELGEKHQLPTYAWPGGYPIFYLFADNAICCPDCANGQNGSEPAFVSNDDLQWEIVDSQIHWEGEPEICSHCSTEIESAYGVPDET